MRQILRLIGVAAVALLVATSGALAQGGGAACPIASMTPQIITAPTFALMSSNGCNVFVFTNPTGTAITAPLATNVPQGFFVTLIPASVGGISITPAVGSLVNTKKSIAVSFGQTVNFLSDTNSQSNGVANYWTVGSVVSGNAPIANSAVLPGTFVSGSNRVFIPNGILRWTNPASFITSNTYGPIRACENAPIGLADVNRSPTQGPRWLLILDYLDQPGLIPVC